MNALALLPPMLGGVFLEFESNAVQMEALRRPVDARACVEAPLLVKLEVLDAFVRQGIIRCLGRSSGSLARLGAQFLGEVTAENLLQQRARIEHPKNIADGDGRIHRDELKEALMRTVGDIELTPPAVFVFAISLPGTGDEHRAGAEDEVVHRSLVLSRKHRAANGKSRACVQASAHASGTRLRRPIHLLLLGKTDCALGLLSDQLDGRFVNIHSVPHGTKHVCNRAESLAEWSSPS